jgi:PKD repeat protein
VSYVVDDPWLGETYVIEFDLMGTVSVIENVLPKADLVVASASDLTVVLDASGSVDPDGSIVRYEWDLDGDGLFDHTSTYSAIQYTYAEDTTYLASVRVTDDRGGTDTASVSVTVQAPPPPEDEKPGKGKGGNGKKK